MPAALADYRAALTAPGALGPVLTSALGRLPIAMLGLAALLYVQRATGSFAAAGLVTAGLLAGTSAGAVGQGRIMDRTGPTFPLLLVTAGFAVAATALVLAVESGRPVALVAATSALCGLTAPALPGASRALWANLVPPGPRRDAAYGYEAISLEVFFVLGPALAALLAGAPWAGTGVVVAAAAVVLGAGGFALTRPVRARRPRPDAASTSLGLGALRWPGLRTVALASLGFGIVIGSVEVGVPAMTAAAGSAVLGGVLLSVWSVASVVAGVAYGVRPWPAELRHRIPFLMALFAALVAAIALTVPAGSILLLGAVMVLAGCVITPQVTAHSLAVERVAPAELATEAFGWVVTAATLGIAAGQSAAGIATELSGPAAPFLAGGLGGVVIAVLLWTMRSTLAADVVPAPRADRVAQETLR